MRRSMGEEGFLVDSQFPPHPSFGHLLPQGEGFPSVFETVDSVIPGKPCVQNDMRLG